MAALPDGHPDRLKTHSKPPTGWRYRWDRITESSKPNDKTKTRDLPVNTGTYNSALTEAQVGPLWRAFLDRTGYCPHQRGTGHPIINCTVGVTQNAEHYRRDGPSMALTTLANTVTRQNIGWTNDTQLLDAVAKASGVSTDLATTKPPTITAIPTTIPQPKPARATNAEICRRLATRWKMTDPADRISALKAYSKVKKPLDRRTIAPTVTALVSATNNSIIPPTGNVGLGAAKRPPPPCKCYEDEGCTICDPSLDDDGNPKVKRPPLIPWLTTEDTYIAAGVGLVSLLAAGCWLYSKSLAPSRSQGMMYHY